MVNPANKVAVMVTLVIAGFGLILLGLYTRRRERPNR
jgi:hypothetical protein